MLQTRDATWELGTAHAIICCIVSKIVLSGVTIVYQNEDEFRVVILCEVRPPNKEAIDGLDGAVLASNPSGDRTRRATLHTMPRLEQACQA